MTEFRKLSYNNKNDVVFGRANKPVRLGKYRRMEIGGGKVIPEINYTLPTVNLEQVAKEDILDQYRNMADMCLKRAAELQQEDLVIELELLPPHTENADDGERIVAITRETMDRYSDEVNSALRTTIIDLREGGDKHRLRSGPNLDKMIATLEAVSPYSDILSIESTGGKSVHDNAVLNVDPQGIVFALGVLGCLDMEFLWGQVISPIANKYGVVSGGDTACAFGNTAMVLAGKNYIPKSISAVVRGTSASRSLVAYENGAIGPGKDCGYENIILKIITGMPMSFEGREAAVAHKSGLGNIPACTADLWSNESVQNIRLLAGDAPAVSVEQLVSRCRELNTSLKLGYEKETREIMEASDAHLDPDAYVLTLDSSYKIAESIVAGEDHYSRTINAARTAAAIVDKGISEGEISFSSDPLKNSQILAREKTLFDAFVEGLYSLPDTREELMEQIKASPIHDYSSLFTKEEYGLD